MQGLLLPAQRKCLTVLTLDDCLVLAPWACRSSTGKGWEAYIHDTVQEPPASAGSSHSEAQQQTASQVKSQLITLGAHGNEFAAANAVADAKKSQEHCAGDCTVSSMDGGKPVMVSCLTAKWPLCRALWSHSQAYMSTLQC